MTAQVLCLSISLSPPCRAREPKRGALPAQLLKVGVPGGQPWWVLSRQGAGYFVSLHSSLACESCSEQAKRTS